MPPDLKIMILLLTETIFPVVLVVILLAFLSFIKAWYIPSVLLMVYPDQLTGLAAFIMKVLTYV